MNTSAKKVWTFGELRQLGITRRGIEAKLKEGTLIKVLHGTYTDQPEITGAVVWEALNLVRRDVILDGASAVRVHRGWPLLLPLTVRVPTGNTWGGVPGLVSIKRSSRRQQEQRNGYRLVPLIDAVATCLDEGSMTEGDLRGAINIVYSGEEGINRLSGELEAMGTRGKTSVRDFLETCAYGTDSGLEAQLIGRLHRRGFRTRQNVKVGGYKWDVCLKELKVVIDVDSRRYHGDPYDRTFIIDRWKTNHAQLLGWTALRITEDCVDGLALRKLIALLERIRDFRAAQPRARLTGITDYPVWRWHIVLVSH